MVSPDRAKGEGPPRAWIEQHFVHDGKVKFCTACRAVPAIPMGRVHGCYGMSGIEAQVLGVGGEWAEEAVDWDRLHMVENDDRPGSWMGYYDERRDG